MEEENLRRFLDAIDYRATCKRFCDDIDQRLDRVSAGMADRAIWELFQNAGDVAQESADGKKAFIKMTLSPTMLSFAHKGKPFTYDTLNSLVKQVSSQSKEEDEDAIGQYGTGFVTTHSFGKLLTITGSMEKPCDPGMYIDIDNFVIDRQYNKVQEFYDKMPIQLAKVKDLALHAPTTPIVREWTELRYDLSTAIGNNGLEKALRGFEAAISTMPYLMTINPTIAEVEIDNQVNNYHIKFSSRQIEDECGLQVMLITTERNGVVDCQKVYFVASEDRSDTIILPLASPTTVRRLDNMAKLFVSYPLIGTENFGFEFIFHSRRFIPEEERNGLYLPKQEANSPQKYENNVVVLNEMSDMLFSTLKKLEHTFTAWDEILTLNLDIPAGSDPLKAEFYQAFKQKWVSFFESLHVFEVDGERRSFSSGKVRLYSAQIVDSLSSDATEFADAVYDAAKELKDVPAKEFITKWSKVVSTWRPDNSECFFSVEDIAKKLSYGDVTSDVLLEFDKYIKAINLTSLFDKYALIPNRDGNLLRKSELRNAQTIPEWISSLVSSFIPNDLKMFVDERFVDIDTFVAYSRNDLRKALNDALDTIAKETFRKSFNPHRCDDSTLISLAKLSLISRTDSEDTYRASAMKVITHYLGIPFELKILPALDSEEKELAPLPFKHLVENLLLEISTKDSNWIKLNSGYILTLHQSLAKWTEYYNRNDKKGLAIDYACFPNMMSCPSMAKDLRNGVNIPEELFDLYEAVTEINLRSTLVSPEYGDLYEFVCVDASAIAKEIEDVLADNKFEHNAVLDIIEYVDRDNKWATLFPRIAEKKADLFMKQVKQECKEGVYRLMKIEDVDKLKQLADLADEPDMDEIIRLGKLAMHRKQNDKAELEYKKALGEYVEDFVLAQIKRKLDLSLSENDVKVDICNVQGGQDLIISMNNIPVYYIEVKSRWGAAHSVEMSQFQLRRCVEEANHYALLCLNMTGTAHNYLEKHIYPPVEETISKLKAVTNIGFLAANAYNATEASDDQVYIGGGYSCVVPQAVINKEGKTFDYLIDCIVSECIAAATRDK